MRILDLGITDFLGAYKIQLELVEKVFLGLSDNTLIITQHKPVITIGRRGSRENILASKEVLALRGIKAFDIDRGGDVTYHCPGQLVAYTIFKLEQKSRDIHRFLGLLEKTGNIFLGKYGIRACHMPGLRGVWAEGKKVGSIGIGVKKWVTYHGLSLNVNPDLAPFSFIRPCGIDGVEMASLEKILGRRVDINDATNRLISCFEEVSAMAEPASKG